VERENRPADALERLRAVPGRLGRRLIDGFDLAARSSSLAHADVVPEERGPRGPLPVRILTRRLSTEIVVAARRSAVPRALRCSSCSRKDSFPLG
jgi:hypothetical protein